MKNRNIISKFQGSGKDHCSSIHTAWIVKETIWSNVEDEKTIYVGLLDARKAFDTVWQDGVFLSCII